MEKETNEIRKDSKSVRNRLLSIQHDSKFVTYLSIKFPGMSLIANERAGSWSLPPDLKKGGVYFKSTDGHYGKWDLSLKRLNLELLRLISNGIVIIDTTRRGKRYPDALSKTIPIWCAVINRIVCDYRRNVLLLDKDWDCSLLLPGADVSVNEREQINSKLDFFVAKLSTCKIDLKELSNLVQKPLRPLWIHPGTRMFDNIEYDVPFWTQEDVKNLEFTPIVCTSASICDSDVERRPNGFQYVQGASDDSEMWLPNFTALDFWAIESKFDTSTSIQEINELVSAQLAAPALCLDDYSWIGDTGLALGSLGAADPSYCWNNFDFVISCGTPKFTYAADTLLHYQAYNLLEGKRGLIGFSESLSHLVSLVRGILLTKRDTKILIHDLKGGDQAAGFILILLLTFLDSDSKLDPIHKRASKVRKIDILDTLLYLKRFRSFAAPSRAVMRKIGIHFTEFI